MNRISISFYVSLGIGKVLMACVSLTSQLSILELSSVSISLLHASQPNLLLPSSSYASDLAPTIKSTRGQPSGDAWDIIATSLPLPMKPMYYHREQSLPGTTKIEATEALRTRSNKMEESEEEVLAPPKSTYQKSQVSDYLRRVCACESQQA